VALNSSSMAGRSFSKNQVEKDELSRSLNAVDVTAQDFASTTSGLGRELRQIVNAELLLNAGDFVHHALKALFTEKLMFLFLEVFA
jgi:hypothetical protein